MMRERFRRERQSQNYADLYSMMSLRKADKNSIVNSLVKYLEELKAEESKHRRRNQKLEARIANKEARTEGGTKTIKLRVESASSAPVDAMAAALQCLQRMGIHARAIHSSFSIDKLTADFEIETNVHARVMATSDLYNFNKCKPFNSFCWNSLKMEEEEVERAVQSVLVDVKKQKQQKDCRRRGGFEGFVEAVNLQ